MTRQRWTIGAVAAAFTLSLAPMAWAQAGGRPNTTGSSTGSAVSRGGEGGSSGSSSGGSSSGTMGSGGSSSSAGSSGGSSMGSRSAPRERAPQNPVAVPRGSRSAGSAVGRAPGSSATSGMSEGRSRNRADVPAYSRPRDSRNVTGTAVDRRPGTGGGGVIPIYPGYYPCYECYGYWGPGYGYGLGLGYYSWYDPFGYGYYGSPWGYGYTAPSYGSGGYSSQYRDLGNLRLKVKPHDAQVYVDGYYVGVVDSFDGVFQKLGIESGAHKIELRAEGYETVSFEVFITPGETVTYKGEMKPKMP